MGSFPYLFLKGSPSNGYALTDFVPKSSSKACFTYNTTRKTPKNHHSHCTQQDVRPVLFSSLASRAPFSARKVREVGPLDHGLPPSARGRRAAELAPGSHGPGAHRGGAPERRVRRDAPARQSDPVRASGRSTRSREEQLEN